MIMAGPMLMVRMMTDKLQAFLKNIPKCTLVDNYAKQAKDYTSDCVEAYIHEIAHVLLCGKSIEQAEALMFDAHDSSRRISIVIRDNYTTARWRNYNEIQASAVGLLIMAALEEDDQNAVILDSMMQNLENPSETEDYEYRLECMQTNTKCIHVANLILARYGAA